MKDGLSRLRLTLYNINMAPQQLSPFLAPGPVSKLQSLASLHLRRDQVLSTILTEHDETEAGYREGPVINTRFGSFPHSTLVGLPWGCQVRASVVDTGSRGRTGQDRKRKRKDETSGESSSEDGGDNPEAIKTPLTASSGFIHLLSPTPESWTTSLPHRTQVVYTPDYSFILHRLRARPGSVLIEAGSGSGSFTHAAARAIYNGYPESIAASQMGNGGLQKRLGKVWSYEFHQQRAEKIQKEIRDHQLEGVVEIVHRDVYQDGFSIAKRAEDHRSSPGADAVFLDVPAPWYVNVLACILIPPLTIAQACSSSSEADCNSKEISRGGRSNRCPNYEFRGRPGGDSRSRCNKRLE